MSSEWNRLTLKEAGVVLIDCDHRTPKSVDEGYPYIAIPQLKNGHIVLDGVRRISHADYIDWTKKLKPQANDVIVVRRCSSGDSAHIPAGLDCAIGQNLVVLRASGERVLPRFLRWLLKGPEWWNEVSKFINVGAVFDSLRCRDIPNFKLTIPPLEQQAGIASVLCSIDDRITLLQETNTTLEAIAQALFKSWFVDFDPVRAKAEGLEPEGMDAATTALFPDSFEESELGLVPRGWKVRSLDSIANYLNGLALQRFPPTDDGWLPVIKIAQLRKGDTVGADRAGRNINPEYIIQNGDVLFSWSGSLEVVIWCGGEGALNQHLFKVTSNDFPKWFYYLWTRQHLTDFQHTAASKATTMGHIQRKHLTEAKVVVPPADMLRNAGVLIEPLLDRWLVNAEKARTLTQLRDTLLPRLISGQLRLPEMEASVEAMLSEVV
ncbi:restriction endonuclease subunit S [Pseudomonas asiatica]|uniref:restriction endonuclease subunit S n=1 Tax=Pseudomonas asiatica TaxID=2219225 RepID=UPI0015FDFAAE|nr:restriction endonuclease subunit S [Pseudomonas asiatica]MBA6109651.1 restriction endonuclease subunit S [Pseudomonas asiatica]MCO8261442.1 restriction endonuclease subunit S [Pseudomonas asiatica]